MYEKTQRSYLSKYIAKVVTQETSHDAKGYCHLSNIDIRNTLNYHGHKQRRETVCAGGGVLSPNVFRERSMLKNILATIGFWAVVKQGYDFYCKYHELKQENETLRGQQEEKSTDR